MPGRGGNGQLFGSGIGGDENGSQELQEMELDEWDDAGMVDHDHDGEGPAGHEVNEETRAARDAEEQGSALQMGDSREDLGEGGMTQAVSEVRQRAQKRRRNKGTRETITTDLGGTQHILTLTVILPCFLGTLPG
jgi:hypothetical protein